MATKLAGWVTDEVMVTPSSSKAAMPLASSWRASSARSCMAYRPARWLRITASPVWWLPTSSRYRSQRRMPSAAGVGPHSAADASQPRTSVSWRSSPARRAWTAACRQASSAAAELAWVQCTNARSRQAWQSPTSSPARSKVPSSPGRASPTSRWRLPDVHLQPQQQPLDPGPGGQPPVPAAAAIRPASSRARSAWSSRPASIRAAPRPVWARARAGSSAGGATTPAASSRTAAGTSPRACALVPAASRWPAARRARP